MPVKEHVFPSAKLRKGHLTLSADRALIQVAWQEDAQRFDLRSTDIVATAVADVEVPANACPMAVGQLWEMDAVGAAGDTALEVLAIRLVSIGPGPSKCRRRYTWQFLVTRKPARDPYKLFPRLGKPSSLDDLADRDGDVLGDLQRLLANEIADAAVASFNAEGGFRMQETFPH